MRTSRHNSNLFLNNQSVSFFSEIILYSTNYDLSLWITGIVFWWKSNYIYIIEEQKNEDYSKSIYFLCAIYIPITECRRYKLFRFCNNSWWSYSGWWNKLWGLRWLHQFWRELTSRHSGNCWFGWWLGNYNPIINKRF